MANRFSDLITKNRAVRPVSKLSIYVRPSGTLRRA